MQGGTPLCTEGHGPLCGPVQQQDECASARGRRTPRLVACTVSALLPLVGSHNADCTLSAALSTGSCPRAQNVETADEMPQSTTGNAHAQQRRYAPTCADAYLTRALLSSVERTRTGKHDSPCTHA